MSDPAMCQMHLRIATSAMIMMLWGASVVVAAESKEFEADVSNTPNERLELERSRHTVRCGAECCYAWLRLKDVNVEYDTLVAQTPIDLKSGTSVDQMCRVLCSHGIDVEAIRTNAATLQRLRFPVIAHMKLTRTTDGPDGHYVLLLSADSDNVQMLEPTTAQIRTIPIHGFTQSWTGNLIVNRIEQPPGVDMVYWGSVGSVALMAIVICAALLWKQVFYMLRLRALIAASSFIIAGTYSGCTENTRDSKGDLAQSSQSGVAIPLPNREQLQCPERARYLGHLLNGASGEAQFTIGNSSNRELELEVVDFSCTCISARLSKPVVPAGAATELILTMHNRGTVGEFEARCSVVERSGSLPMTFSAEAIGLGAAFPAASIDWRVPVQRSKRRLNGIVITTSSGDRPEVQCHVPSEIGEAVRVTASRVMDSQPLRECRLYSVEIDLEGEPTFIDNLTEPVRASLVVEVKCSDFDQRRSIDLVLAPQATGL